MSEFDIVIFRKDNCVKCKMTKRVLEGYGVKPVLVDIYEADGSVTDQAQELMNKYVIKSAPIVVVKDKAGAVLDVWSDFQIDKIKALVD